MMVVKVFVCSITEYRDGHKVLYELKCVTNFGQFVVCETVFAERVPNTTMSQILMLLVAIHK